MKQIIFFIVAVLFGTYSVCAQTFHAIMFGATEDEGIGWSCKRDMKYMKVVMAEMAYSIDMNLATYYCEGQDMTASKLKNVIESLNCGHKDVVFFYYTGHGGRAKNDSNTKFPQLLCKPTSDGWNDVDMIPVDYVKNTIAQKHPQFFAIFTDCCNNENRGITPKVGMYTSKGASVIKTSTKELYRNLLKNKHGHVIISSSKPGQISNCMDYEPGMGMASFSFLVEMELAGESNPGMDWETLISNTKKRTDMLAREQQKRFGNPEIGQEIISEVLLATPNPSSGQSNAPILQPVDKLKDALLSIIDPKVTDNVRLNRASAVLSRYFNPNASIMIVGRDGRTILEREKASIFLDRIALAPLLVNFVILEKEELRGKLSSLTIHEIYTEN